MALVALLTRRIALFSWVPLWAQLSLNPHSGYGIGLPHLTSSGATMGMGRLSAIGIGYPLAEQPAHSAFLSSTQADFSGYGRRSVLRSSQQYSQVGTGGLQNLGLSFARGKGWGFALGLAPQALQGYYGQLRTSTPIPLQFSEKAEGILSRAQLSLAFRRRSLAAGYQLGYLWGSYDRQRDLGTPPRPFLTT